MKVKFKLHGDAIAPKKAHKDDAGFDLTGISKTIRNEYIEFDTGVSLEIPSGHVGYVFPRSSISNTDMLLSNGVGVIDSNYRGTIKFRFNTINKIAGKKALEYNVGDRIGQLIIMPIPSIDLELVQELQTIDLELVQELQKTERGVGGFGSTGTSSKKLTEILEEVSEEHDSIVVSNPEEVKEALNSTKEVAKKELKVAKVKKKQSKKKVTKESQGV